MSKKPSPQPPAEAAPKRSPEVTQGWCLKLYATWQKMPLDKAVGKSMRDKLVRYRYARSYYPEWNLPEIPHLSPHVKKRAALMQWSASAVLTESEQDAAVKQAEQAAKKALKEEAERFRAFYKVFANRGHYRIMDSVIKGLKAQNFAFTTAEEVHNHASLYRTFRLQNPGFNLAPLPFREEGLTPLQKRQSVLSQRPDLAAFEFPYDTLSSYDGVIVTSAQFDCELHHALFKTLKEVYIPFREKKEGRRYALVALPIVFGPVDLSYHAELDEYHLRGTFANQLRGHMLLRDTWFGSALLKVMRVTPSMESDFLTDNAVDHLQNEASRLTVVAAPVVELKHRAQPGLEVGDHYPRAFLTTGTLTVPDYGRDNLGLASRRATLSQMSTNFGFTVIDLKDNEPFFRDVIDIGQDGCFHDLVKVKDNVKKFKFTPHGVKEEADAVDTLGLPDYHNCYADIPVRQAFIGEGGLVPVLAPHNATLHDFIDCTATSPFLTRDRLYRLFLNSNTFGTLRKAFAYPEDLDTYVKKRGMWKKKLHNTEGELVLAGTELVHLARSCPETNFVYIPSNHNDWLDQMVWNPASWSDENTFILARLVALMESELGAATKQHAEMATATLGVGRTYLEHFVRKEGKKFGVEAEQFLFRNRLQTFLRPTNGKVQIEVGRHGDKPMFRGKKKVPGSAGGRVMLNHFHVGEISRHFRVNGVMGRRRHYFSESTTNWTHSTNLIFKTGQQMMLHPRQDGTWWPY